MAESGDTLLEFEHIRVIERSEINLLEGAKGLGANDGVLDWIFHSLQKKAHLAVG